MKKLFNLLFVTLILILIFFSRGCETNPVVAPQTVNQTEIGTLYSSKSGIIQNIPTSIKIIFSVNNNINLYESSVALYNIDNSNNIISQISVLKDNGDSLNGDEFEGDGEYSGIVLFNEAIVKEIRIAVLNPIGKSTNINLKVYSTEADTNYVYVDNVIDLAKLEFLKVLSGNINNYGIAMNQTVSYLTSLPRIANVSAGGTGIIFKLTNGIKGGINFAYRNSSGDLTMGGISSSQIKKNINKLEVLDNYNSNKEIVSSSENIESKFNKLFLDPATVGNRKVLIYEPFYFDFSFPVKDMIISNLARSNRPFTITSLINNQATVLSLIDLYKYGLIILHTHGKEGEAFLSGEEWEISSHHYSNHLRNLADSGKIFESDEITLGIGGAFQYEKKYWAISYEFINEITLTNKFPNSIIINNSCQGTMGTQNLKKSFLDNGASTYFGFTESYYSFFPFHLNDVLSRKFAQEINTLEAFGSFTSKELIDHNIPKGQNFPAVFQMLPNTSEVSFPQKLINGNFENSINSSSFGWAKLGEVDTRRFMGLGKVVPKHGSRMGLISTKNILNNKSTGSISQIIKVDNETKLSFYWNFLSEEFLEYVGYPNYQDFFEVTITTSNLNVTSIFKRTIDDIFFDYNLERVSPLIVFDQGDVYQTKWQFFDELNLSPFQNQYVTVTFSVSGIGDHDFRTVILLDDIKIE